MYAPASEQMSYFSLLQHAYISIKYYRIQNKEMKCIDLTLHRNHSYLKEFKRMEFKIMQLIVSCR